MEGRRGRPPNSERQRGAEGGKGSRRRKGRPPNVGEGLGLGAEVPSPSEAKLLRKLEAQGEKKEKRSPFEVYECYLPNMFGPTVTFHHLSLQR